MSVLLLMIGENTSLESFACFFQPSQILTYSLIISFLQVAVRRAFVFC